MKRDNSRIPIVIADDNKEDRELMRTAFEEAKVPNPLIFVGDGRELLELLNRCAQGEGPGMPGLVLMDLNMPRLDGKATLQALRANEALRHVPVVIVSTSAFHAEVVHCYSLGANSFLVKPFDFGEFVGILKGLADYWMQNVELPVLPVSRKPAEPRA